MREVPAMQLICYPEIREQAALPVCVTGIGVHAFGNSAVQPDFQSARLIYTVSGTGVLAAPGKTIKLTPGSIVSIPENSTSALTPLTNSWSCHWTSFRHAGLAQTSLFTEKGETVFRTAQPEIYEKLYRQIYDTLTGDEAYGAYTASALLYRLLILAHRDACAIPDHRKTMNPAVVSVLDYIHEHYTEEIALEQLCTAAGGLSEQYLCRLFKQSTGMRPVEYIIKKRIASAQAYLEKTDLPVNEVAEKTGFHNTSYFYRNFKKFTGMSPLECRQKAAAEKNHGR